MTTATLSKPTASDRARSRATPGVPGMQGASERAATDRLLRSARGALAEADAAADPGERYAASHLAALRAAAAVLAARAAPSGGRARRPASAWALVSLVAPDLAEWAAFFAAGADKRAAAQAGIRGAVSVREADDLRRDAAAFTSLVEATLGMLPLGLD